MEYSTYQQAIFDAVNHRKKTENLSRVGVDMNIVPIWHRLAAIEVFMPIRKDGDWSWWATKRGMCTVEEIWWYCTPTLADLQVHASEMFGDFWKVFPDNPLPDIRVMTWTTKHICYQILLTSELIEWILTPRKCFEALDSNPSSGTEQSEQLDDYW